MKIRDLITGMMAATALTAGASAGNGTAYLVTGSDLVPHQSMQLRHVPIKGFTQIGRPHRDAVGLIHRATIVTAATVSRDVSETPALPHLARVQYGGTTILVDPEVNYLKKRPGGLDEGHSIVRAQRTFKAVQALPARTIRRPEALRSDSGASAELPTPRAILLKPNVLDRTPIEVPGLDNMPQIPKPRDESKRPRQVALAG